MSSVDAAQRLSPTEQMGAAADYAKRLESISSVTSMKEIGAYLAAAAPLNARLGNFEPGKEKVFDHATSTPVGAKSLPSGAFVFVFRDANNNLCELPAAPGEENAARAFALLDRSDVLREFKNSILLPLLHKRLDQQ